MNEPLSITELFRKVGIEFSSDDGYSEEEIEACEERIGYRLPARLRDYYRQVGKHVINQAHNHLASLSNLGIADGYLIFLEENQGMALFGIPINSLSEEDPIVWQGAVSKTHEWRSEELSVSAFLEISLYWQAACGGLPFSGVATELERETADVIEKNWPLIKTHNKMQFFLKTGQILVLTEEKPGAFSLLAAGTTLEQFALIDEVLGIDWDWSIYDDMDNDEEDDENDDE
jgi:hypothetical protein